MKTIYFTLLFLTMIRQIFGNCELNIGVDKFTAFFGKGIFYNGEIDSQFKANSTNQYKSPRANEIEYFYVSEKIGIDSKVDPIKIEIESSNVTLTNPKIKYISHKEISKNISTGEINIIYNCTINETGVSIVKMKLTPKLCQPFELIWIKECMPVMELSPLINVGINGFSNIIKNGTKMNTDVFTSNSSKPLIIKTSTIFVYLSNSNNKEQYRIKPIQVVYPQDKGISFHINGYLIKGGVIPSFPSAIMIDFTCNTERIIDVEIMIPFENNHIIKMHLKNECKGSSKVGLIRFFFKIIYWLLLCLMFILLGIVAYFFFTHGQFAINELYMKGKEYLGSVISHNTKHEKLPDKSKEDDDEMNSYEEVDLINCQINSSKKSASDDKEKQIHSSNESNQPDYGGI